MTPAAPTEWISWDTASELTGIKVPTIEHAVRVGRIERRPRLGNRPSLRRDSVLAWADWYRGVEQERAARPWRVQRSAWARPAGWLNTDEAAEVLGKSVETVVRRIRAGELVAELHGARWWVDPESVRASRDRRSEWISFAEAARILGCSQGVIRGLAERGELRQRKVDRRTTPSLERAAVEAYPALRAAESGPT